MRTNRVVTILAGCALAVLAVAPVHADATEVGLSVLSSPLSAGVVECSPAFTPSADEIGADYCGALVVAAAIACRAAAVNTIVLDPVPVVDEVLFWLGCAITTAAAADCMRDEEEEQDKGP